jgi:hypothetical protein
MLSMLLALVPFAHADEGMWLPEQLPEIGPAWQERGLELPPEALSDPLEAPLGAIASLGFCSASFVSPDGLLFTNHHCVEGYLQFNSSAEANRHRDGHVAATPDDELPVGPGGHVWVVESIEDVTDQVLRRVGPRTGGQKRYQRIEEAKARLVRDCERTPHRRCRVAAFLGGSSFRLIRSLEIQDVRLVAAPPLSVGQFGGDVDNWMWPRHGTDFALLRAYVSPDGESAPFSAENVPYEPPHHLEIDPTGAEPDSFVMVAGYPGRTRRHTRAMTLAWYSEEYLPDALSLYRDVRAVLQRHADADPEAAARLGAPISRLSNGIKNSDGLLEGLARGGLVAEKRATEQAVEAWLREDRSRSRWLGDLETYEAVLREDHAESHEELVLRWLARGSDLLGVARTALRWAEEREKPDVKREAGYRDRDRDRIEDRFRRLDRTLVMAADRDVLDLLLQRYQAQPEARRIEALDDWLEARGGREAALDALYDDPPLTDVEARLALLDQDAATLRASEDPWLELAAVLVDWEAPRQDAYEARRGELLRVRPTWYAALAAWHAEQGTPMYDDANGTLRLTLGHVRGYTPKDGLLATPQTTLAGLADKAGDAPFDAPSDLVEAARRGADSPWADPALGDVPLNFLATLDTTGGNSGSAVLDGRGRLVGLLFDGTWESIAADWVYLPTLNRSICVDIRGIAWVLQQLDGTERIREELGLTSRAP